MKQGLHPDYGQVAFRGRATGQIIVTGSTLVSRSAAVRTLSKLPRDASPVRLRNRDQIDGRPRGYVRKAGLSRINLRTLAHRGELPGITKSSW